MFVFASFVDRFCIVCRSFLHRLWIVFASVLGCFSIFFWIVFGSLLYRFWNVLDLLDFCIYTNPETIYRQKKRSKRELTKSKLESTISPILWVLILNLSKMFKCLKRNPGPGIYAGRNLSTQQGLIFDSTITFSTFSFSSLFWISYLCEFVRRFLFKNNFRISLGNVSWKMRHYRNQ